MIPTRDLSSVLEPLFTLLTHKTVFHDVGLALSTLFMEPPNQWTKLQELVHQVTHQQSIANTKTQALGNEHPRRDNSMTVDPYREWSTTYDNQPATVYRSSSAHSMDRDVPVYDPNGSYHRQRAPLHSGVRDHYASYKACNPSWNDPVNTQPYMLPAHKPSKNLSTSRSSDPYTTRYVSPASVFPYSSNYSSFQPST